MRVPGLTLSALARLEGYEIQGVLAQSSFAVVYRARDLALKQPVAIKEYLPEALVRRDGEAGIVLRASADAEAFEQGLQAFVSEAELLARCHHPSLLRVLRLIRCHGTAYRVMPCCPYPTLLEHRQRQAAPPAASTLRAWFDDLLDALQALHAEGCVHGAVAPGNVLLQPDARPLLLDLDMVRGVLVSERTQLVMAALEPCFEPIEQRAPVSYMVLGPWTDLYSLAATLHFCISGELPSPPHAPSATPAFEPLDALWRRLAVAQPGLGNAPDWLHVLDACLCENPQDRPQSVAQVKALLDPPPVGASPAAANSAASTSPALVPVVAAAADVPDDDQPEPVVAAPRAVPPEPTARQPVVAAPAGRRWLRPVGLTTLLAAAAVFAIIVWPGAKTHDAEASPAAPWADATAGPTPSQPVVPAAAMSMPPLHPADAAQAAPAAAAVAATEAAPVVPDIPSPRERCAGRERYALWQCMQAQCAKKSLAKHDQCRRLREENRLS